jgi:hypothetical protein
MNVTQIPNLKPLRDYDEHEVINFFAHASGNVNKGTFVTLSTANGNTNVWQNATNAAALLSGVALAGTPTRATVLRHEVTWKVDTATSGQQALGLTLYDVRETNDYGEKYIFRPRYERKERDVVVSGEAVPILCRGFVKINGFVGTPGPGSGAVVSTTSGGYVDVAGNVTGVENVGKFLTSADADGYALFKLEL